MKAPIAYGIGAAASIATSLAGGYYTSKSVRSDWYDCIRPVIAPPRIVFPIVWTTLYVFLAIAIATSLTTGDEPIVLVAHALNMALNIFWCKLFFADKDTMGAMAVLLANLAVAIFIAASTSSTRVMYLFVPYIAWLSFASVLNGLSAVRAGEC
jgi:tryptophan-rich sensory protein